MRCLRFWSRHRICSGWPGWSRARRPRGRPRTSAGPWPAFTARGREALRRALARLPRQRPDGQHRQPRPLARLVFAAAADGVPHDVHRPQGAHRREMRPGWSRWCPIWTLPGTSRPPESTATSGRATCSGAPTAGAGWSTRPRTAVTAKPTWPTCACGAGLRNFPASSTPIRRRGRWPWAGRSGCGVHQLSMYLLHTALFGEAFASGVRDTLRECPLNVSRANGPGRPLRQAGDRPAGLPDRPLQPALLLLHAAGRAALAAQAADPHRRRDHPADRHRGDPPGRRPRSASPAVSRCCGPACPRSWRRAPRCTPRPKLSLTTNGIGLDRLAAGLREAGLDRVNVSLDTLDPERFDADRLPAPLRRRARRAGTPPPTVGLDPGQDQHRAAARGQRRRGASAAAVRPRAWLRAALHRADAARRAARLEPRQDDHRRGDPDLAERRVRAVARSGRARPAPRPRPGWSTAARPRSA